MVWMVLERQIFECLSDIKSACSSLQPEYLVGIPMRGRLCFEEDQYEYYNYQLLQTHDYIV